MCLMLYLGSAKPVPLWEGDLFSVEEVRAEDLAVKQWFDGLSVYFIGSHSGCSCGFPSVKAERPVRYYEGIFDLDDPEERQKDIQSTELLIALIREHATPSEPLLLYPVWAGDEGNKPKGHITWTLADLDPNTLVFTEDFMYEVQAEPQFARDADGTSRF